MTFPPGFSMMAVKREPISLESEDKTMKDKTRLPFYCIAAVLLVAVLASAVASIYSARSVREIYAQVMPQTITQEDNVKIMSEYEILSTLPISTAYKSGSASGLNAKEQETLEMASAVLDEIITEDMTPYEKELAVYQWMTTSLSYDTGILQVIPTTQADCDNPYGVLKYHNAVCVGYATTFRLFMQMMDIDCMVVHNPDLFHSWNLVKLDDHWYHVDIYSDENSSNYANFNMNDDLCAQGHEWDRDFFPAADSLEYNYGCQNAVEVTDIYEIPNMIREALDEQTGYLFLRFPTIDEAHAQLVEAMVEGSANCMMESDAYWDLWMDHSWMHLTGSEYILGIFISGYEGEDDPALDIPDEERARVEGAVSNAFGEDYTWDGSLSDDEEDDFGCDAVEAVAMN